MEKITSLYIKYKNIIAYVLWGGITTVINWVTFYLCNLFLNELIANVIAWFVCVSVAFLSNKKYVFYSKSENKKMLLYEIFSFFVVRLLTLGVEEGLLFIGNEMTPDYIWLVKIAATLIVVVLNYVFSKIIVFKKEKSHE